MDEHDYVYPIKPLMIPGLVFLIVYPVIVALVYIIKKMPSLEVSMLLGIYCVAALGILALWFFGRSKHIQIQEQQIVFHSILGDKVLEPHDIRRVAFYFDGKGQEVAQIRTSAEVYYVTEFYFPFPELMSDLENFILRHGVRSNLASYAGLGE